MSKKYISRRMTEQELAALEQMLLEQMELQVWYRVEFLIQLGGETIVTIQ
jgi:hypothetical protein